MGGGDVGGWSIDECDVTAGRRSSAAGGAVTVQGRHQAVAVRHTEVHERWARLLGTVGTLVTEVAGMAGSAAAVLWS